MMEECQRCLCCGRVLPAGEVPYHAKCLQRLFGMRQPPAFGYTQDEMNELAKKVVAARVSVPGVQPKLSLHLEKSGRENSRLTIVGLEGGFILKPQAAPYPHLPEAEHFCMLLARECGIPTVEFGLMPLKSGELAYVTRRMDRTSGGMLHQEDFCQILEKSPDQKYNGSIEQIGKALRKFSNVPMLDVTRLLDLTLFCFLTGNSDMHLKNFSMLRCADGHYELVPAYDLVPVALVLPEDQEELALTVNGKKNRLKLADFLKLGENLHLSARQTSNAVGRITRQVSANVGQVLPRSFLPIEMQDQLRELVKRRLAVMQSTDILPGE